MEAFPAWRWQSFPWLLVVAAAAAACDRTGPTRSTDFTFDFSAGSQGWTAGFADYGAGEETLMELESDYRALPAPLGPGRSALFISGNNRSDDLFMFFARRVDGLRPNTSYDATFTVEIATDVPRGCGGVGGSPGESVYLKAGAAPVEPQTVADALGILRLTVDHGNQANDGANARVLGTIENTTPCELGTRPWELKRFESAPGALTVRSDAMGALWVLMGTDSAFEGTTSLFYTRFAVVLNRR